MGDLPNTIVCPYCGNVNSFLQDFCMKCRKPLEPIRSAMQSDSRCEKQNLHESQKTIETPPSMPDLPRGNIKKIKYLDRNSFLIRGVGNRDIEIAARFFKRLKEKDLKNVFLSIGELSVEVSSDHESRSYYFVRKDLDDRTCLLMAIRIATVGPDLYVEWRNYFYRKPSLYQWWWWIIVPFWGGLVYSMVRNPDDQLKGFQIQENEIFQLSVRASLEEAIDLAGISKSLIQRDENSNRVI